MNLCSIASGSSGNCIYIGNQNTNMLLDVGISKKRIELGLNSIDVDPSKLDGIFITHEHSDHINGLGVMMRKYKVPVYATLGTAQEIVGMSKLGALDRGLFRIVKPNESFLVNDVTVTPFSISHDAADPVCYTFVSNGHKVSVATDLGTYDDYIISALADSEILLLEANHDVKMLEVGAYPYYLKKRILGDRGHLSNENSGKLIKSLLHSGLKHIFLGHLSRENNYPELAYEAVRLEIAQYEEQCPHTMNLKVADREEPSGLVSV